MRLTVDCISQEEVYKDMARIPETYRKDTKGKFIDEARICKVTVLGKSKLLALRGMQGCQEPSIYIDAKTRKDLVVQPKSEYDFELRPVGLP